MSHIFDCSITADRVSVTFSSTFHNVDRICEKVALFLEQGFRDMEEHFFSVNLVMREALTNAVRHGNRLDPGKIVKFSLRINGKSSIEMVVEDQGDGFDWQKAKSCPPGEDDDHGRGLAIMTSYFSSFGYNKKGNRLVLEKKLHTKI